MKLVISILLLSLFVKAQPSTDPLSTEPALTDPTKEKVEDSQKTGGALKVQKKPAKIEGLEHPPVKKHNKKKKKGAESP